MRKGGQRILGLVLTLSLILSMVPMLGLAAETDAAATGKKLVALTFDDGPGNDTERLLDGLAQRGVHVTFFMLGNRVQSHQDTVRRMYQEGHQIANHSYDHANLVTLSLSSAQRQVTRTNELLNQITGGSEAYYFRAPYGNSNASVRARVGAPLIYWTVDPQDWKDRNSQTVSNRVVSGASDGAIILLHDIHPTSVTGALDAVDKLLAKGYEFVTLKELFRRRGVTPVNGTQYYSCKPTGTDLSALAVPTITISVSGGKTVVTLDGGGQPVYYTTDGSPIGYGSQRYTGPFTISAPCTIRAVAAWDLNGGRSPETTKQITQPPAQEPVPHVTDGVLTFDTPPAGETIYYLLGAGDVTTSGTAYTTPVSLTPGQYFSYYAAGAGKLPTTPQQLLYSDRGNLFRDIAKERWYYEEIDALTSRGVMNGMGNNYFRPERDITRGMMATLLYRISGEEKNTPVETTPFTDVPADAYYAEAVAWCQRQGIIDGVAPDRFAPERAITRQEMAKMTAAYLTWKGWTSEQTTATYDDWESVAPWAQPFVAKVTEWGLMQGSNHQFRPMETTTRAEAAAVLNRLLDQQEERKAPAISLQRFAPCPLYMWAFLQMQLRNLF